MPNKQKIHKIINYLIAIVWGLNGLFCKVLNFVPRHEQIVARILGDQHEPFFTKSIGILEVFMAIWVLSSIKPRFCATVQIIIVAIMNVIEFLLVPDHLLFGKFNSIVALFFIVVIYLNEFFLNKRSVLAI